MFGSDYNLWAILLATVANQAIGALWFSPLLFATPWLKGVGLTNESIQANPSKMPFVLSLITALVLAVALSWANTAAATASLGGALLVGLVVGIGVAAMASAPHYAFPGRSLKLYLIDQGHTVVTIVVMSAIIGLFR